MEFGPHQADKPVTMPKMPFGVSGGVAELTSFMDMDEDKTRQYPSLVVLDLIAYFSIDDETSARKFYLLAVIKLYCNVKIE